MTEKTLTFWILSANVVKNRHQTNETENSSTPCFILLLVQQEETSLQLPTAALRCHTQAALEFSLGIGDKRKQKQRMLTTLVLQLPSLPKNIYLPETSGHDLLSLRLMMTTFLNTHSRCLKKSL